MTVELFGAAGCPYTSELREDLRWSGIAFTEYDVDLDTNARARLRSLVGGWPVVPILVENGRIKDVGWRGRACAVGQRP
jgi:glutaredoxin 3